MQVTHIELMARRCTWDTFQLANLKSRVFLSFGGLQSIITNVPLLVAPVQADILSSVLKV